MTFKDYWKALPPEAKTALAKRAQTSKDYLSQVANGHRGGGRNLIERLVSADPQIQYAMFFGQQS